MTDHGESSSGTDMDIDTNQDETSDEYDEDGPSGDEAAAAAAVENPEQDLDPYDDDDDVHDGDDDDDDYGALTRLHTSTQNYKFSRRDKFLRAEMENELIGTQIFLFDDDNIYQAHIICTRDKGNQVFIKYTGFNKYIEQVGVEHFSFSLKITLDHQKMQKSIKDYEREFGGVDGGGQPQQQALEDINNDDDDDGDKDRTVYYFESMKKKKIDQKTKDKANKKFETFVQTKNAATGIANKTQTVTHVEESINKLFTKKQNGNASVGINISNIDEASLIDQFTFENIINKMCSIGIGDRKRLKTTRAQDGIAPLTNKELSEILASNGEKINNDEENAYYQYRSDGDKIKDFKAKIRVMNMQMHMYFADVVQLAIQINSHPDKFMIGKIINPQQQTSTLNVPPSNLSPKTIKNLLKDERDLFKQYEKVIIQLEEHATTSPATLVHSLQMAMQTIDNKLDPAPKITRQEDYEEYVRWTLRKGVMEQVFAMAITACIDINNSFSNAARGGGGSAAVSGGGGYSGDHNISLSPVKHTKQNNNNFNPNLHSTTLHHTGRHPLYSPQKLWVGEKGQKLWYIDNQTKTVAQTEIKQVLENEYKCKDNVNVTRINGHQTEELAKAALARLLKSQHHETSANNTTSTTTTAATTAVTRSKRRRRAPKGKDESKRNDSLVITGSRIKSDAIKFKSKDIYFHINGQENNDNFYCSMHGTVIESNGIQKYKYDVRSDLDTHSKGHVADVLQNNVGKVWKRNVFDTANTPELSQKLICRLHYPDQLTFKDLASFERHVIEDHLV